MFKVRWKNEAPVIRIDHLDEPTHYLVVEAKFDDKPWFYDIKRYLERQEYLEKASITNKKFLRRFFAKFFLNGDVLYKRNFDSVLHRCMDRHKASTFIRSIHEVCEGVRAKGPAMAKKILRDGYYWTKWRSTVTTSSRGVTNAKFLVTRSMSLQLHWTS